MRNTHLIFSMVVVSLLNVALAQDQLSILKIVNKYCNLEFSGDSAIDRSTLIKFSKEREKFENRKDTEFSGKMIYWKADSIFIVKKFKVDKIIIKNQFATCLVIYERLAKTEGYGDAERKIVDSYVKNDSVVLNLIFENNKVWIYDPPPPRISLLRILKIFQADCDQTKKIFGNGNIMTEPQRKWYENMNSNLWILKKLENSRKRL